MLGWMCGHTRLDRIRNKEFREKLGVASLVAKMRKNRLRWFSHVQKRTLNAPVRRIKNITVEGKRGWGRPKKILKKQIKINLRDLHFYKNLTNDKSSWKHQIHGWDFWLTLFTSPLWHCSSFSGSCSFSFFFLHYKFSYTNGQNQVLLVVCQLAGCCSIPS